MKKNDKTSESSLSRRKLFSEKQEKRENEQQPDKLNKIPMPEKVNIKTKILNINNTKYNSLKPEKSPDKMSSHYKHTQNNIVKKKPGKSANTTKTNTSTSTSHNSIPYKSVGKTNTSFNAKQKTSYDNLTTSPTLRSEGVVVSENSDYIDNSGHFPLKQCQFENFLPVIEVDFSDKIRNLVDKISNFLIVSSEEPNFIYNQDSNCFIKKTDIFDELDALKPKSHNRKILSANLDRVFIDNLMQNQKEYEINKLDMFYQEIESIFDMAKEVRESSISEEQAIKAEQERNNEGLGPMTTSALVNIEMIKDYSEVRMSTYRRLLASCNINFKDITLEILKTIPLPKKSDKNEQMYIKNDPYSDVRGPKKEGNTQNANSDSKGKDKNSLINEKLEMLRNLKEKKDQILNENQNQRVKRSTKANRTIKIKNFDGTMTEIDVINESYLNENVVINFLPTSNINNVNKPSEQNLHFKKVYEEFEDEEEALEKANNSADESEMIIDFDDCEDQPAEIIKQNNDTLLQTGSEFIKTHKRSKSHLNSTPGSTPGHTPNPSHPVDKQIQPMKSGFLFAKKEFNKDRPLIHVKPEMLRHVETEEIDQIHPEVRKNFAASIQNNNCVII